MQTFVNVLYRLLSNPEYVEPLRHDVETAVAEEGWTKAGMDKMHKIDSFVRETQRLDDLDGCPFYLPSQKPQLLMHRTLFSDGDPSRIASIHIFQWSHCSCGYADLCAGRCHPQGRRDLSKPEGIRWLPLREAP
jgi:hypothetical protein